ncbi:MurR/RpiR family transcriptional regulator [Deinococcus sp. KSM4-11]|uniref:MurR/RpiR family transcriptional regulator n=1 Tax=Deinococcus sp. KSM4-11 TaxID=2568654 RepID=UPI0010A54DB0|nr:MurR/RpiR family transcriptional regulator [Deinococcus sp. KSM4-11]THF85309.1 MurR/RpiR family transcriptional regulator [Deinococcus sp. KSM4-11]
MTSAPPATAADLLRAGLDSFGPRDRQIARHFIDHLEELPFLSAGEIAEALGVSGAAITRFSQRVGFEGYPHLQRSVRQELRATLGLKQPGRQDAVVARYWASERANLDSMEAIPEDQLLAIAHAIAAARQVWLLGARSSHGLALTAEYMLSSFRPRVQAYSADLLCSRPEHLLEMTEEDAVLVYTVRRYSRATTRVTTALRERGVQVLLITDQGASPLGRLAHHSIRLPTQGSEVIASLAPFLSITSLIASLVARAMGGGQLEAAERLKAEFGVYEY